MCFMREKERKIIFLAFLVDRLSKYFFNKANLSSVNKGISFGIFNNTSVFLLVIIFLFFIFFLNLLKIQHKLTVGLVTVGGLSNIIDRFIYGGVIDFLNLPLISEFNFADIFICFGILLIVVDLFKPRQL